MSEARNTLALALFECGPNRLFGYYIADATSSSSTGEGLTRRDVCRSMPLVLDVLIENKLAGPGTEFLAMIEHGAPTADNKQPDTDGKQSREAAPLGSSAGPVFAHINMPPEQVQPTVELFRWVYGAPGGRAPDGCITTCTFGATGIRFNFNIENLAERLPQALQLVLRELELIDKNSTGFTAYSISRATPAPEAAPTTADTIADDVPKLSIADTYH